MVGLRFTLVNKALLDSASGGIIGSRECPSSSSYKREHTSAPLFNDLLFNKTLAESSNFARNSLGRSIVFDGILPYIS